MSIVYTERELYPDELRLLKTLRAKTAKAHSSFFRVKPYLTALLIGISCTYVCTIIPDSIWLFILGTIAVFAFGFVLFTPYEQYKLLKRHKAMLKLLNDMLNTETVKTSRTTAQKIAIAPEYEDECDLYLIKLNECQVLHLWDLEHNLHKKFPCLEFEIYEESFFNLTGRQIYPMSENIAPEKIDKKAKWNFMSKFGAMGHLDIEETNFEQLIEKYNKCA